MRNPTTWGILIWDFFLKTLLYVQSLWFIHSLPSSYLLCSSSISYALRHPETSISRSSSEAQDAVTSADLRPSDCLRSESAGVVDMMLLKSYQNMHVPFTQVVLTLVDYLIFHLLLVTIEFSIYQSWLVRRICYRMLHLWQNTCMKKDSVPLKPLVIQW